MKQYPDVNDNSTNPTVFNPHYYVPGYYNYTQGYDEMTNTSFNTIQPKENV